MGWGWGHPWVRVRASIRLSLVGVKGDVPEVEEPREQAERLLTFEREGGVAQGVGGLGVGRPMVSSRLSVSSPPSERAAIALVVSANSVRS